MGEQIQTIRDLINKPLIKSPLLKNGALWNQLCSCLDVIEDSEFAIDAYFDREFGESIGEYYLRVYGLLQALFVQQNAVRDLNESLGIPNPLNNYPRLKEIKEIRNASSGHPTKKGTKKQRSYHHISRPTLKADGFQLVSFFGNGTSKFEDISIPGLIADQRTCISEIFTLVIRELQQKEKTHKEMFKMEKLASFFPAILGYSFEKVFERIIGGKYPPELASLNLQQIKKAFQDFREALAKRGIEYGSVNYECELLEYPLAELEAFFQNAKEGKESNINEKTAFIFADFVEKKIKELKLLAEEIDNNYSR